MSMSRVKLSSIFFTRKLFVNLALLLLGLHLLLAASGPAQDRGVGGVAPLGAGQYRNSWAVVIGINEYAKAPRLNYAVNDAKSVVAAVQKLGFASDKILLLLDHEATRQRIEQLLYGTLRRTGSEDRVFVFFAGHGMTASLPRGGEEGFLLPIDGDPSDLPLTAIAMEDLRRIARRIPAKHILFAVDACYSGFAISRDVPPNSVDNLYLEAVTKEPAVQIITAGRKGEPVLEEEGHGLFTRRLLTGLTGLADTDQNGILTAQELATWLESRIMRDSKDRQHPQYSRLDGDGQFVFVVAGRQRPGTQVVPDDRQKLQEEIKRLAEEAESLKRQRGLLEEQRKLQEEKQRIEIAKLEAERALFKAEVERLALERTHSEKARVEVEQKQAEEQAKLALAKLEAERARLQAQEERIAEEKARAEENRLEVERARRKEEAAKQPASEVIAKATRPASSPPRPLSSLPKAAEAPRYKVGDSWTIRFSDGRTATRSIRAIEENYYVFQWGLDLLRYYDSDLVLRRQVTPDDGQDVYTDLLKQRTMNFPLSVDKSWEFEIIAYQGRGWNERRVFRFKVVGIELVRTTAGTFPAFKIEESSFLIRCSGCPLVAGTLGIRHWWYAPEVKFPVKIVTRRVPKTQKLPVSLETDQDYELAAFNVKQ